MPDSCGYSSSGESDYDSDRDSIGAFENEDVEADCGASSSARSSTQVKQRMASPVGFFHLSVLFTMNDLCDDRFFPFRGAQLECNSAVSRSVNSARSSTGGSGLEWEFESGGACSIVNREFELGKACLFLIFVSVCPT